MSNNIDGIVYSLSEIEALTKKAMRGVGFAWGHAEEGAKALRWLAAHELKGVDALVDYLGEYHTGHIGDGLNNSSTSMPYACPFLTGAACCDAYFANSAVLAGYEGKIIRLDKVAYPLLLLPYFAYASPKSHYVRITWDDCIIQVRQKHLVYLPTSSIDNTYADDFSFEIVALTEQDNIREWRLPNGRGQAISAHHWQRLNQWAGATYVMASESSRLRAGPG